MALLDIKNALTHIKLQTSWQHHGRNTESGYSEAKFLTAELNTVMLHPVCLNANIIASWTALIPPCFASLTIDVRASRIDSDVVLHGLHARHIGGNAFRLLTLSWAFCGPARFTTPLSVSTCMRIALTLGSLANRWT